MLIDAFQDALCHCKFLDYGFLLAMAADADCRIERTLLRCLSRTPPGHATRHRHRRPPAALPDEAGSLALIASAAAHRAAATYATPLAAPGTTTLFR